MLQSDMEKLLFIRILVAIEEVRNILFLLYMYGYVHGQLPPPPLVKVYFATARGFGQSHIVIVRTLMAVCTGYFGCLGELFWLVRRIELG